MTSPGTAGLFDRLFSFLICILALAGACQSQHSLLTPETERQTARLLRRTLLLSPLPASSRLPNPGGLLVIHIFASWCGPCHEEMPFFERAIKSLPAGSRIYMISLDENPQDAKNMIGLQPSSGIPKPFLMHDPTGNILKATGFKNIPLTAVYDEHSNCLAIAPGPLTLFPETTKSMSQGRRAGKAAIK